MKITELFFLTIIMVTPITAMAQTKSGIDQKNLDKSVRPQDDFYRYATGGWQKRNPLPAAYSRFGSFDQLQENNNKQINSILSELLKKTYKKGSIEQKLSDFYKLAIDSVRRDREGILPVKPLLDEITSAKTKKELHNLQIKYSMFGYGMPFSAFFGADEKNSKMNILNVYQGSLTLGQRDYYINNDSSTVAIREAYKKYIEKMFLLYGFSKEQAEHKMQIVFRMETMFSLISRSATELRDPLANYNKVTLSSFENDYPNIPLVKLIQAVGVNRQYIEELIVGQPKYLEGCDKILATYTADELRTMIEWDVIQNSANYLSSDIRKVNFDFFNREMRGSKEDYPLWKRATDQVQGQLGEALGRIYVEKYFPASSKKMMEELVVNLQKALSERIDAQEWMNDTTKIAAHKKLNTFYVKIGYPNKWTDFSALDIEPTKSYYENMLACYAFNFNKEIKRNAGKPVDKDQWFMYPQTVNAYYNPTTNEICFPAGILQYPFFDPKADAAFNYGAIGVVIGHEMTHGFDDQGRLYDAEGNMNDWWTKEDAKGFEKRADMYADFFSNIKVLPDLNANGRFTLGENLADHGGLQVAYYAFEIAKKKKILKMIDGFTPEQRFFISYAGVWGQNITEQEIRNRVKNDPHSIGEWRVNGALPHIDMWYDAFDVKSGDKLFIPKEKRLQLW